MMGTARTLELYDYDSLIKRADGTVPYNGYLWPTEEWRPGYQKQMQGLEGRWHFGIIALADGRFATTGEVHSIRCERDEIGRAVVFADRNDALRVAAARMIRRLRAARNWTGDFRVSRELAMDAINWSRAQVAVACQSPLPKPITLPRPPIPPPPKPEAGLPLFDLCFSQEVV